MAIFNDIALESGTEIELRYTVSVNAEEVIEKSHKEKRIEQWSIATYSGEKKNIIRVRKTNDDEYELTMKPNPKSRGNWVTVDEHDIDITKEQFEAFKSMAVNGQIKTRYFIKDEDGNEFEVDLYEGHMTGDVFATIELEIEKGEKKVTPKLPFESAIIIKDNDKITELYDTVFLIVNEGVSETWKEKK